ncbi:hypothetical protein ACYZT4_12085 [Pseudomonas sp. GB2N2]
MKAWAVVALSLICQSGTAADYSVPEEHWKFMDGYKYEYSNCAVGWSVRTATFLLSGDGCNNISPAKIKADALRSIDYVKNQSSASNFFDYYTLIEQASKPYSTYDANQDAWNIWASGCSDFKNGLSEGDFTKWLKIDSTVSKYPKIKNIPATKLYMDGWETARLMKSVLNCNELAPYRTKDFASGVDIKNSH